MAEWHINFNQKGGRTNGVLDYMMQQSYAIEFMCYKEFRTIQPLLHAKNIVENRLTDHYNMI